MKAQDLKNSILQMAMEGKLVPQDPNDEPASVLLERIREEKEQLIKEKKIKRNNKESVIFRKNNHFYEKVGKKGEEVCIDDEIPFEVPNNWELVRLGSITRLINEKIMEGPSYPYLQVKYLRGESDAEFRNKGRFIKKGTIIILVDGNAGDVFKVPVDGYMGSTFRILYIPSVLCEKYILYFIESFKTLLRSSRVGIAIPHLNKDVFNNLIIGIPPIGEQIRIVNQLGFLENYLNRYDILEQELSRLNIEFPDKIKDSVLQEAIQGKLVHQDSNDEPASVLLERIKEEKEQLIKEKKIKRNKKESFIFKENNHFYEKVGKNKPVCIDNEIPFEIPNIWGWTRIKNISEFVTKGTTPRGGKEAYKNEGIKFLRVENIGKNGEILLDNIKYVSEDTHYNFLKRSILKENDLLISIAGALGRTAIVPKCALPLNTNQAVSFVRWINANLIFVPYIEKVINSPEIQKSLLKQSKITAIPNLTLEIIRECIVPIPPLEEQKRIVEKIDEIFDLM